MSKIKVSTFSKTKPYIIETKFDKIKSKIQELLLRSSAHGLPRLIQTKSILIKLIWILVLVNSSVWGSIYVIRAVIDFTRFETSTTISVINENQAEFPSFTLCSSPKFKLQLNQTIISAYFDLKKLDVNKHFLTYNDSAYSQCFRFNSGRNDQGGNEEILKSTKSGLKYGLAIDLNFVPEDNDITDILIYFHNKSSIPSDLTNGGYWLSLGSVNYFVVNRIFFQNLEEPYYSCLRDARNFKMNKSLINLILSQNVSYSQQECFHLCSYMFALEKSNCNCNSTIGNFRQDCDLEWFELMKMNSVSQCIQNYLVDFLSYNKVQNYCAEYCPQECDSIEFQISTYNQIRFNQGKISDTTKKKNLISKYDTFEEFRNHSLRVYIYYDSLNYVLISQYPKIEVYNFISNIGGIFSLFFGISFISFIELIEIIIEVINLIVLK